MSTIRLVTMSCALVLAVACPPGGDPDVDERDDAGVDAGRCSNVGVLHAVFADDGVDPAVWGTNAPLVADGLHLGAGDDLTNTLVSAAPVVLDGPLEVEIRGDDALAFFDVHLENGQDRATLSATGSLVRAQWGGQSVSLGSYDRDRDQVFVLERTETGIEFSTRLSTGAPGLSAFIATPFPPLARVRVFSFDAIVTSVARDVPPTTFCPASSYEPSLHDGAPEPDSTAIGGSACTLVESPGGLQVTLPAGTSATCGYSSSAAVAPPTDALLRFTPSSEQREEIRLTVAGTTARIGHAEGRQAGEDELSCDLTTSPVTDLRAARALRITFSSTSVRCAALDASFEELASVESEQPSSIAGLVIFTIAHPNPSSAASTAVLEAVELQ